MAITLEKPYTDQIVVFRFEDVLAKAGKKLDEHGECIIDMTFYDGKAVAVDNKHLIMVYPTIDQVKQSKEMQRVLSSDEFSCPDDIDQFRVALKYGELQYI